MCSDLLNGVRSKNRNTHGEMGLRGCGLPHHIEGIIAYAGSMGIYITTPVFRGVLKYQQPEVYLFVQRNSVEHLLMNQDYWLPPLPIIQALLNIYPVPHPNGLPLCNVYIVLSERSIKDLLALLDPLVIHTLQLL